MVFLKNYLLRRLIFHMEHVSAKIEALSHFLLDHGLITISSYILNNYPLSLATSRDLAHTNF